MNSLFKLEYLGNKMLFAAKHAKRVADWMKLTEELWNQED